MTKLDDEAFNLHLRAFQMIRKAQEFSEDSARIEAMDAAKKLRDDAACLLRRTDREPKRPRSFLVSPPSRGR